MTEEESNQILAEVDADHSGQVDFDEFKLYWVKAKQAGPGEPRKKSWAAPWMKSGQDPCWCANVALKRGKIRFKFYNHFCTIF